MPLRLRFVNGRPEPVDVCARCGASLDADPDESQSTCPDCGPTDA